MIRIAQMQCILISLIAILSVMPFFLPRSPHSISAGKLDLLRKQDVADHSTRKVPIHRISNRRLRKRHTTIFQAYVPAESVRMYMDRGWSDGGASFLAYDVSTNGTVPVRHYSRNYHPGDYWTHVYSVKDGESPVGMQAEEIAFYAYDHPEPGTIAIYDWHKKMASGQYEVHEFLTENAAWERYGFVMETDPSFWAYPASPQELVLYPPLETRSVTTWEESRRFCEQKGIGDTRLATKSEWCSPRGQTGADAVIFGGSLEGYQWVPINDAPNEWVQVGNKSLGDQCKTHLELGLGYPEWGDKEDIKSWRTSYILCSSAVHAI